MSDERVRALIEASVEIAGGAVGGALGFLAAGPVGAAMLGASGSAAAFALKSLGQEATSRLLSQREQVRVGGVLALAAAEIGERIGAGEHVRADGFFENGGGGRSAADEVAEAVLIKSQREPEEKKLRFMAHLLAGIAFSAGISRDMAHQLIKIAERLTYRQLCILKLAVVKDAYGLRSDNYNKQTSFTVALYQLLYELLDLDRSGLLDFGGRVLLGVTDVPPGTMRLQGLGRDLYALMRLSEIPNDELEPIASHLR